MSAECPRNDACPSSAEVQIFVRSNSDDALNSSSVTSVLENGKFSRMTTEKLENGILGNDVSVRQPFFSHILENSVILENDSLP